jgi:hypothetical protein
MLGIAVNTLEGAQASGAQIGQFWRGLFERSTVKSLTPPRYKIDK